VAVINLHTHNVMWQQEQFDTVYSMDRVFSRHNARDRARAAQAEIQPGETCGNLPAGFDPNGQYVTRPWKRLRRTCTMASDDRFGEGGGYRLLPRRYTPDAISLV